jgi:hypothetical protein
MSRLADHDAGDRTLHNPFSTRRVRPGAMPYFFSGGIGTATILERLAGSAWRGEIVGPHGSGKSTLLATLLPAIEAAGRTPRLIALHDGQRRLPESLGRMPGLDARSLLVIDGYEQLGRWQRWRLARFCRRRGCGLLVTTHASVGLPTIVETGTTAELARQLIERLTPGERWIDDRELAACFAQHQGNLREVLFDCYDRYSQRQATEKKSAGD